MQRILRLWPSASLISVFNHFLIQISSNPLIFNNFLKTSLFGPKEDLNYLRKFIIKDNGYIDDKAILMLSFCKNSLTHLEIISCIGVTDNGVISLTQLEYDFSHFNHFLTFFSLISVSF
jgi:hypothetical protein